MNVLGKISESCMLKFLQTPESYYKHSSDTAHAHHEYVVPRSIPITVPTSSLSPLSAAGTGLRHDERRHVSINR